MVNAESFIKIDDRPRGLRGRLFNLDNVIMFSQSLQAHVEHVTKIFVCFKEANWKLNPSKGKFMGVEVEYLDHTVTP